MSTVVVQIKPMMVITLARPETVWRSWSHRICKTFSSAHWPRQIIRRTMRSFISILRSRRWCSIICTETRTENGYNEWFAYQPIATQVSILRFLVNNGFSQESQIFAFQAMEQMMQEDVNFNLQASFSSPFFVDTSAVSGNTPEEIKFREVYAMLQQSPKFKQLFNNLFETTFLMNAKFKIENIPQSNPTGVTNGNCRLITLGGGGLMNEISIHRPALLTKSNPDIAVIILHECIHAYLNVKLRHPSIGMSLNEINNMDIQSCLNTYYSSSVSGQAQHSFFIDFMIPTMVEILTDIKYLMLTAEQMFAVNFPTDGGAILYEPMGNPPHASSIQMQWNWNDYFTYLSYQGLETTNQYPVIFPPYSNIDYIRFRYISAGSLFNP